MTLALFDLDNTLIGGDSDHLWGEFLVERGVVDGPEYARANAAFYEQYKAGTLDIVEFLHFALHPLTLHPVELLFRWRREFVEEKIRPILLPAAFTLLDKHKRKGHARIIITATNRFVTEPIAALLGVEHLIATPPEQTDGRFTGRFVGTPCYREGKITLLTEWMCKTATTLEGSWFYSDSQNDIPLLERVTHPVAVDADETLRRWAMRRGVPVISLRGAVCPEHHGVK